MSFLQITVPSTWTPLIAGISHTLEDEILGNLREEDLAKMARVSKAWRDHPIRQECLMRAQGWPEELLSSLRTHFQKIPVVVVPPKFANQDYITVTAEFQFPMDPDRPSARVAVVVFKDIRRCAGIGLRVRGRDLINAPYPGLVATNNSDLALRDFSTTVMIYQSYKGGQWVRSGMENSYYIQHFHFNEHMRTHPRHRQDAPHCAGGCPPIDPYDTASNFKLVEDLLSFTDPLFLLDTRVGAPDSPKPAAAAAAAAPVPMPVSRRYSTIAHQALAATRARISAAVTSLSGRTIHFVTNLMHLPRQLEQMADMFASSGI